VTKPISLIASLIDNCYGQSTLKKYGNYLWTLGSEIIRDTTEAGFDKSKPLKN